MLTPNPITQTQPANPQAWTQFSANLNQWLQYDRPLMISVKAFGATGTGLTDDTVAIQAAINAAQNGGLWFPAGTYLVSSTLNVTQTSYWCGQGANSVITWTNPTLNVVNVNSNVAFAAEQLVFITFASATAGAILTLTGPTGAGNGLSWLRNVRFYNGYIAVNTLAAYQFSIDNCYISTPVYAGVIVQNTLNADAGDSFIGDSLFLLSGTAAMGIIQYSSGGLRIDGNKFDGGAIGYQLSLEASGIPTSELLVIGNSFDSQTTKALDFVRPSGSLGFINAVIVGNQINGINATSASWTGIATDSIAGEWLSQLTIANNQITMPSSTGSPTFTGIQLGTSARDFMVADNEIFSQSGSGSPVNYGITIASGIAGGTIGVNRFDGAPWTNKVLNNAGAAVQVLPNALVTGVTGSFNVNSASGGVYAGTSAVSFANAFDSAPVVTCSPEGVSTGIAAYPSSVTKSGFTLNASAAVSQTAQTAKWTAQGIL